MTSPAVLKWPKCSRPLTLRAKLLIRKTVVPQWNEAVGLVITGKAGANVMGDWAGGEFQVANMKAGEDYDCLPGLGL